ncbi:MAG: hypothetical protein ACOCV3_07980, partial [Halanaerobiales bacterium]
TYENIGNRTASNVIIQDNYDKNYLNIQDAAGGNTSAEGEIVWEIASLSPGASDSINYTLSIKDDPLLFGAGTTQINNTATIVSNAADYNINDNTP